ncbi:hypothetical protein IF1G_07665 [Cordyceps javanica]|uniref:Uncharacterized protein n=1 Tax=Cordyceps javanica TaxID=43265 RepID=A0A545UWU0_9HYPO|nr:hypothetical protein IF1G_07665 [Cordyceps javanica]
MEPPPPFVSARFSPCIRPGAARAKLTKARTRLCWHSVSREAQQVSNDIALTSSTYVLRTYSVQLAPRRICLAPVGRQPACTAAGQKSIPTQAAADTVFASHSGNGAMTCLTWSKSLDHAVDPNSAA